MHPKPANPSFLGAKLLYERVCPSVTQSFTCQPLFFLLEIQSLKTASSPCDVLKVYGYSKRSITYIDFYIKRKKNMGSKLVRIRICFFRIRFFLDGLLIRTDFFLKVGSGSGSTPAGSTTLLKGVR